jgi:hypothetical protein
VINQFSKLLTGASLSIATRERRKPEESGKSAGKAKPREH